MSYVKNYKKIITILAGILLSFGSSVAIFLSFNNWSGKTNKTNGSDWKTGLLAENGGVVSNGLITNKHQKLVQLLNLTPNQPVSSYTNQSLQQNLKSHHQLDNWTISIRSGSSDKSGQLLLKITNNNDPNQTNEITISGFVKYNSSNITIASIKLNYNNWFQDKLPVAGGNTQTISQDKTSNFSTKYLESLELNYGDQKLPLSWLTDNWKDVKLIVKKTNNDHFLSIATANFQPKKYQDNNWVSDNQLLSINSTADQQKNQINFPDIPTLKTFLINHLEAQPTQIRKHYPSYFFVKLEKTKEKVNSEDTELLRKIFNTELMDYYKGDVSSLNNWDLHLSKSKKNTEIVANDFEGTLSLEIEFANNENIKKNLKHFRILGDDLIKNNKVSGLINYSDEKTSLFTKIKKTLNTNHQHELRALYSDTSSNASQTFSVASSYLSFPFLVISNDPWKTIYATSQNAQIIKNKISKWNLIPFFENDQINTTKTQLILMIQIKNVELNHKPVFTIVKVLIMMIFGLKKFNI